MLEVVYQVLGFLWYSLLSLWKTPKDDHMAATLTLTKGLYTPSEIVLRVTLAAQAFGTNGHHKVTNQERSFKGELRVVGQEEVYERVVQTVRAKGSQGGSRGYFRVERIGYDTIAIDPETTLQGQNW